MKRDIFGFDHPFFEPLWRRIVIVAVCLTWAAFEFAMNEPIWAVVFGAIGLVAGYNLLILRRPRSNGDENREQ